MPRGDVKAGGDLLPAEPTLPRAIRLTAPHGFITETGRHRYWQAGDVIAEPDEIRLLTERGAHHEPVE